MYRQFKQNNRTIIFADFPEKCPECHNKVIPNFIIQRYDINFPEIAYAFLQCPNPRCKVCFSAYYEKIESEKPNSINLGFKKIEKGSVITENFSDIIQSTSPSFIEIYNQAFQAEQMGLNEISGVGFRKSLEFLIKDYLIGLHPEREEKTKKKFLGHCIAEDIKNEQIKKVAKRATWLGNDETHYVRIWKDKDLSDLKSLIKLTLNWIEMEKITQKLEEEMPDSKKGKK